MARLSWIRNQSKITDPSLIPERTESYQPFPNADFISMIENMVEKAGYSITDRKFKTNKKKSQVFGVFDLDDEEDGLSTQIGMINSYDKSRRAAIAIGANVHRCSNLSFSSFKAFRMHRGKNFWDDIRAIMRSAQGRLRKGKESVQRRYDALDQIRLTDNDRDWFVGHLLCENVIGVNQVSKLKKTLTGEEDYVFGTDTWYDLNMHLTDVLKDSHPYHLVDDHMKAEDHLTKMARVKMKNMSKNGVQQSNADAVIENLQSPLEGEEKIFLN